jgi:hypothetical protein
MDIYLHKDKTKTFKKSLTLKVCKKRIKLDTDFNQKLKIKIKYLNNLDTAILIANAMIFTTKYLKFGSTCS